MAFRGDIAEIVEMYEHSKTKIHSTWERVKLSQVLDVVNGFAFKSSQFSSEMGVPLIRIRDVLKGETKTYYKGELPENEDYWVNKGDILVGMDGDFNIS